MARRNGSSISWSILRPPQVQHVQEQLNSMQQPRLQHLSVFSSVPAPLVLGLGMGLQSLRLSGVTLQDPQPMAAIGVMQQLTRLHLRAVGSSDVPPELLHQQLCNVLHALTELRDLGIEHDSLRGDNLMGLHELSKLTSLSLSGEQLGGSWCKTEAGDLLPCAATLQHLSLAASRDCLISLLREAPAGRFVRQCTSLRSLELCHCQVNEQLPSEVAPGLTRLVLKSVRLHASTVLTQQSLVYTAMYDLPQLRHLELSGSFKHVMNKATAVNIRRLCHLTHLSAINPASAAAAQVLLQPSTVLQHLRLPTLKCDESVQLTPGSLPDLRFLGSANLATQVDVAGGWQGLTQLTGLETECLDRRLAAVLEELPRLRCLTLTKGQAAAAIAEPQLTLPSLPNELQELMLVKSWCGLVGPVRPTMQESVRQQLQQALVVFGALNA